MYQIKKSSNLVKVYNWLWKTDASKFKTMCPFFWMYVLTIFLLPFILLAKILYYILPQKQRVANAMEKISETTTVKNLEAGLEKLGSFTRFWNVIGKILKYSFFLLIGGMCLAVVGLLGLAFYTNTKEAFTVLTSVLGMSVVVIFGALGIGFLAESTMLFESIWKPFKFLGNMAYSTYKNMCPLIKWE